MAIKNISITGAAGNIAYSLIFITENLDGTSMLLPRVGFNWDLTDDVTIRGGVGRYSGGMPLVWISNAYTNDGVTMSNVYYSGSDIDPANVAFDSVPQFLQDSVSPGSVMRTLKSIRDIITSKCLSLIVTP